jgi:N-acetylglutamate synthase-like GNAT family acetyltransferase
LKKQIDAWSGRKFSEAAWIQTMDRDMVWVLEFAHNIFGFAHLRYVSATKTEIMGLYLHPDAKGYGYGKQMLNTMIQHCKNKDIKSVILTSTLTSKEFYQHFGFKAIKGATSIVLGGVPIECQPMEKQL